MKPKRKKWSGESHYIWSLVRMCLLDLKQMEKFLQKGGFFQRDDRSYCIPGRLANKLLEQPSVE